MHSRILHAAAGTRTVLHSHGDGSTTIQKVDDVSDAVERAKALHNQGAHTTATGDKHAASIPIPVLTEWAAKRGKTFADCMQDEALLKQFLQDPDNQVFRIWKGAL
ncbi:hypothetical protein [Comamonas terrigena]|uniref:hypothetical protein n=1 Tax=Comamonas terrigena TaxID=32013 RepID=UPI00235313AA|nr:hypothetical protein [Comamonas terrigena]